MLYRPTQIIIVDGRYRFEAYSQRFRDKFTNLLTIDLEKGVECDKVARHSLVWL